MDYKRTNGVTGVNLADFDTHIFYSGLLNKNEAEIQKGLDNIFSINKATVKEGVQYDNLCSARNYAAYFRLRK